MTHSISFYGIFVWILSILFFFYEFFLRIFLGTIATEVMDELHITIEQFSFIGAAYYVTYGIMQTPVGILAEKIGVRIILSVAAFLCALGVFWLGVAQSFYPAFFSRFLIGFGSSFAFVSLLILALNWFPKAYFGFLCGIALFLGAVGPLLAGAPLAYLYTRLDGNWRLILFWIGIFGVVLSFLLALFVRTKPKEIEQKVIFVTPHEPLTHKLLQLLKNGQIWWILLCSSTVYVAMPLLAAYWGTAYLQTRGLDKTKAAFVISMIWIGYAIGNPVIGKLSDMLKRRKFFLLLFGLLGFVVSMLILYLSINNYFILIVLFFLLGLASSSQGLTYAMAIEHTPSKLHSAALGLNNTAGMLMAAVIPALASSMIQASLRHSGRISLVMDNFTGGLSLIPLAYGVATLVAIFGIKETFCRQQHEIYKLGPLHKASDLL